MIRFFGRVWEMGNAADAILEAGGRDLRSAGNCVLIHIGLQRLGIVFASLFSHPASVSPSGLPSLHRMSAFRAPGYKPGAFFRSVRRTLHRVTETTPSKPVLYSDPLDGRETRDVLSRCFAGDCAGILDVLVFGRSLPRPTDIRHRPIRDGQERAAAG